MGSLAASEIVGMPAVELAEAIRGRASDPMQVTAAHLERIRAVDPVVRAFVEVFEEESLAEAGALGQRADLAELPLAGVPVAIEGGDQDQAALRSALAGVFAEHDVVLTRSRRPLRRLGRPGTVGGLRASSSPWTGSGRS